MIPINRAPDIAKATGRNALRTPRAQFLAVAGLCGIGLLALAPAIAGGLITPGALTGMAFYSLAFGICLTGLRHYPHLRIGLCNGVTTARLMLVCTLIAALFTPGTDPWAVFVIASLTLSLDGLDGWLARREGLTSDFGAAFDMEVDAALAMVLALTAYLTGQSGAFILALGLPRYGFALAERVWPWIDQDLPERFSRKVVCVLQIAVLIAVIAPVVGRGLADLLVAGAALALIWSFWVDLRWLWRSRA